MTDVTTRVTTAVKQPKIDEQSAGLFVLRVALGLLLVGHGGQKLFGWFGGAGLTGSGKFFEFVGYSPGEPLALLSGLAEFGGGILLIIGLGVPLAAAVLVADMSGALAASAHLSGGAFLFTATTHGYEEEAVLALAALALVLTGGGRYALDYGRPWERTDLRLILAATGVVAGLITMALR